jgi:hypothetical protein
MDQGRNNVIRHRLNKMTEWAKQRREFLANHAKEWNEDWYIRIGGNGFRAVSLNNCSPLFGFADKSDEDINEIIRQFKQNNTKNISDDLDGLPERRVQCWLIKQAINDKLNLKTYLGLDGSIYEDLLFVLDEASFGDKDNQPIRRLDILAVGIYGGIAYPVLIELKSKRKLGNLLYQLGEYQSEMKQFELEFKRLFKACVNRDVNFSKYGKIMVWPKSPSGKKSRTRTVDVEGDCREDNITVIESGTDKWSNSNDFSFHHVYEVFPPV